MKQNTIEVFLNEEYGYKTWIWRPNMSEDEFISWWQNLSESEFIKYYFNIKSLPGTIKEYVEKNSGTSLQREVGDPTSHRPYYYCHFHDVDDSYIAVNNNLYKFQNRSRNDWKDYWIDHTLAKRR